MSLPSCPRLCVDRTMRILITGATGFIGRHIVAHLSSCGKHELVTTATRSKEEAEALYPILKNTTYIPKNLNQMEDNYYAFFGKPDCVIHFSIFTSMDKERRPCGGNLKKLQRIIAGSSICL